MKDKILEAVQISKTYGEGESAVHALKKSDLTLENGTFASIIGSSGSGKSTLLKILGGLLPPTTGKVLLDGQDIYAMNAEQLAQVRRQKIGFIFQDFRLFPEYTVRDNILIPFYLDHRAPDEQMLHKLTGILGIAGKLHSRPAQLSRCEAKTAFRWTAAACGDRSCAHRKAPHRFCRRAYRKSGYADGRGYNAAADGMCCGVRANAYRCHA